MIYDLKDFLYYCVFLKKFSFLYKTYNLETEFSDEELRSDAETAERFQIEYAKCFQIWDFSLKDTDLSRIFLGLGTM